VVGKAEAITAVRQGLACTSSIHTTVASPGSASTRGIMGSSLVIVESPAKARTIEKYLGEGFRVEASVGHIRDLPENAEQIPASKKKLKWARLGVNTEKKFQPLYVVPPSKKSQVKFLKDALKDADALYLATDEDREGESIVWYLMEVLKPKVPVKRLVFNEITRTAI
jgi:DNA topoisomerase-1